MCPGLNSTSSSISAEGILPAGNSTRKDQARLGVSQGARAFCDRY